MVDCGLRHCSPSRRSSLGSNLGQVLCFLGGASVRKWQKGCTDCGFGALRIGAREVAIPRPSDPSIHIS
eukprot:366493-Alexandrium_andersonii.AAC.1